MKKWLIVPILLIAIAGIYAVQVRSQADSGRICPANEPNYVKVSATKHTCVADRWRASYKQQLGFEEAFERTYAECATRYVTRSYSPAEALRAFNSKDATGDMAANLTIACS